MTKVQLTFTNEETDLLKIKASQLGYNITKYIKTLLGKEILSIAENTYPTFTLSEKAKKQIQAARKEHHKGKSTLLDSVADLDKLA